MITGPIFGYYLWDMRQAEEEVSLSLTRAAPMLWGLVICAIVVVVVTVGYSIYLVGTPGQQRDVRLDEQRVDDLRNISRNIDRYLELNEEMPASLQDMKGPRFSVRSVTDPETDVAYDYRVTEGNSYELCAIFSTDSAERTDERRRFSETAWDHGAGRACFQLEARSEPDGTRSIQ